VKTLTVGEAQGQLAELIAEAHQGEVIVLTDGEKQVWLDTDKPIDLEKNLKPLSGTESRRCYQQANREFDALEHHLASQPAPPPEVE
jgi:putative SOS response-associated peptidase YedK